MSTSVPSRFALEVPAPQVRERKAASLPGIPMFLLAIVVLLGAVALFVTSVVSFEGGGLATAAFVAVVALFAVLVLSGVLLLAGLTMVAPREARVLQFLGRYIGTVRQDGLQWVNPISTRLKISTRIRNHETSVMKVNDADGNPIEIAAVVVWQVEDTALAVFEVDDFEQFVSIQAETAVRQIANDYPYDAHVEGQISLRDSADEITEQLSGEITERVAAAGVRIIESRITHLAYAQEIAQAMLQRQQASAVVAARRLIVEGAVGMVDMALERIEEQGMVKLDEERTAAMVSNLLVVLCADRATQPVVNTGTLYH